MSDRTIEQGASLQEALRPFRFVASSWGKHLDDNWPVSGAFTMGQIRALLLALDAAPPAGNASTQDAKDAERYRWLRNTSNIVASAMSSSGVALRHGGKDDADRDELDRHIDAALSATTTEGAK